MLLDTYVGKTSLIVQFIQKEFCQSYNPTIEDSYIKQLIVDGETYMPTISLRILYRLSDAYVGKTSVIAQFIQKEFQSYDPTIEDSYI